MATSLRDAPARNSFNSLVNSAASGAVCARALEANVKSSRTEQMIVFIELGPAFGGLLPSNPPTVVWAPDISRSLKAIFTQSTQRIRRESQKWISGYIDTRDWFADLCVDKRHKEKEREEQQTAKVRFCNFGVCIGPHRFEVTAIDLLDSVHDYGTARRSYKFIAEREQGGGFFKRLISSAKNSRHFIVGPQLRQVIGSFNSIEVRIRLRMFYGSYELQSRNLTR